MSDASTTVVPALVLKRVFDAPRERVYQAWTDPKTAARFLGPGKVKATEIEMDVRPGGSYRIVMLLEDGSTMPVRGIYREVQPPQRLAMTWRWEEDNPQDEYDTLLTLEFNDLNGKTELVLTHDKFAKAESRENHAEGWNEILDALPAVL